MSWPSVKGNVYRGLDSGTDPAGSAARTEQPSPPGAGRQFQAKAGSKPGDVIESRIEGIGALHNQVQLELVTLRRQAGSADW